MRVFVGHAIGNICQALSKSLDIAEQNANMTSPANPACRVLRVRAGGW